MWRTNPSFDPAAARPWRAWHAVTVLASAAMLVLEARFAPAGGWVAWTAAILWAPVCGYLIITHRIRPPASPIVPVALMALSLGALVLAGGAMFEARIVSLAAALLSIGLWGWILWRMR